MISIANPAVVAFATSIAVGVTTFKVNLPSVVLVSVSRYRLVAIGFKGGVALATSGFGEATTAISLAVALKGKGTDGGFQARPYFVGGRKVSNERIYR